MLTALAIAFVLYLAQSPEDTRDHVGEALR